MPDVWQTALKVVLGTLVGLAVGLLPGRLLYWWLTRRDHRQWALQRLLWELENQIREEQLSDDERAWCRRDHERHAVESVVITARTLA